MPAKNSDAVRKTSDREIAITRVLDAPRERVWEAWADPEQVVKWWGPRGFSTTSDRREFKPGGTWRHTMAGPDGAKYPGLARFEEIVKPERIVYTNGGGKKGDSGVSFRQTVTFKDLGNGKTELTMRLVFQTAAMREHAAEKYGAVEGGRQTLERLGEHLAGEFVLSRLVDAPRERVWSAWTEPERLARWFGPKGVKTISVKMNLRPGGVYHYGMRAPDGKDMWGKWTFREIAAPERLVFVGSFSDDRQGVTRHPMSPNWPLEILSTILFQDMGGKTLLTVKWSALNPTAIERAAFAEGHEGMRAGWGGTFEQLDAYLARAGGETPPPAAGDKPAFVLVLERLIDAPRERVWKAWSEPEQMKRWFAPRPLTLSVAKLDFRTGGSFDMTMHAPDGADHPFTGRYVEVVPPERIAWTGEFPYGPKDQMRTTVDFVAEGRKTRLKVRAIFTVLTPETEPHARGAKQGWTMTLDQLAEIAEGA